MNNYKAYLIRYWDQPFEINDCYGNSMAVYQKGRTVDEAKRLFESKRVIRYGRLTNSAPPQVRYHSIVCGDEIIFRRPTPTHFSKRFSVESILSTRKALKDDAAGNKRCTMTDLDLACDMLDVLIEFVKGN